MKGFVDNTLVLSNAQTVAATTSSTNHVRLPNTTMGEGHPLYLHIAIDSAYAAEAGTITFALYDSADDTTFTATSLTEQRYTSSLTTANTELFRWPLPSDVRQYVQVRYTCSATPSNGTIDAWLDWD